MGANPISVDDLAWEIAMRHPIPLQLFVLAVTSFLFVGCRWQQVVEDPLPAIADIREVTASYFDSDVNQKISFNVPLTQLPTVFAALEPAFLDTSPAKWVVLGQMDMILSNGRPFRIDFYDLEPTEQGAFAAGETFEQRIYYRGGSSQKLLDALRKAYEVASKTKVD